ncbi:MAG: nucleotidyltransferase [Planctomycetaceae bacterium]
MTTIPSDHELRLQRMGAFYRDVLSVLDAAGCSYLIGGSYAAEVFTGIPPHTKDLDLFVRRKDLDEILKVTAEAGFRGELTFPHWLAKIHSGDGEFIDVIFSSGNGLCSVDDEWFEHSRRTVVLDREVNICPPEEMIWSKSFIMERERFDGGDIAHFLRRTSTRLDWSRLLNRFDSHWRVLMFHLLLFGYVYPHLRSEIPAWVMRELSDRLQREQDSPAPSTAVCYGTLLSREQYLCDVQQYGLGDARVSPTGAMTPAQVEAWTAAIDADRHH